MSLVAKALDLLEQYIRRDPNPEYVANALRCVDAAREEHAADLPMSEERAVLEACDDLGHAQVLDIHSVDRELGNALLARRAAKETKGG